MQAAVGAQDRLQEEQEAMEVVEKEEIMAEVHLHQAELMERVVVEAELEIQPHQEMEEGV